MQTYRLRGVLILTLLLFLFSEIPAAGNSGQRRRLVRQSAATVSYAKIIYPMIKAACLPCHTEDAMNPSQLYLDTYENMMAGGKHGKPIQPGDASKSLLIKKLTATPPFGDPMPLKRKTLLGIDTINMIESWINQGAKNN